MSSSPEQGAPQQLKRHSTELLPYTCQLLHKMLLAAVGMAPRYDPKLDTKYRQMREVFLRSLRGISRLRRLAKVAEQILPDSLSDLSACDRLVWQLAEYGGNAALVRFQGDLLTAILKAGIEPIWELPAAAEAAPDASAATAENKTTGPTRAQRNAERRRTIAQELRKDGYLIKQIACELGCSQRAVHNYLKDLH